MTCPNCKYKYKWDGETLQDIKGERGEFYENPVKLERDNTRRTLYACPSCGVAFIEP